MLPLDTMPNVVRQRMSYPGTIAVTIDCFFFRLGTKNARFFVLITLQDRVDVTPKNLIEIVEPFNASVESHISFVTESGYCNE
jgi:hypothetical protein